MVANNLFMPVNGKSCIIKVHINEVLLTIKNLINEKKKKSTNCMKVRYMAYEYIYNYALLSRNIKIT